MNKYIYTITIACLILLIQGCSNVTVNEYRAGCTVIDGKAKYGYVQGVSGKANGVYVYVGKLLRGKVTVKCTDESQEIHYNDDLS